MQGVNDRKACPSFFDDPRDPYERVIMVYNSKLHTEYTTKIEVGHGSIEVEAWDSDTHEWLRVTSDLFCFQNQDSVEECDLFIYHPIPPLQR